jgi:hypothetical protein
MPGRLKGRVAQLQGNHRCVGLSRIGIMNSTLITSEIAPFIIE